MGRGGIIAVLPFTWEIIPSERLPWRSEWMNGGRDRLGRGGAEGAEGGEMVGIQRPLAGGCAQQQRLRKPWRSGIKVCARVCVISVCACVVPWQQGWWR